jgi:hypothetical protein
MGKLIDLTDRTFDMLTVIKRVEDRKPGRPMWLCQCECGNTVVVSSTNLLRTNGTKSCGCLLYPILILLSKKTGSQPVGQPPGKRTNIRLVATLSI